MKKFAPILFLVLSLVAFATPTISLAAKPGELIPCGRTDEDLIKNNPKLGEPCDFTDFLTLINNLIDFTIKYLALPLSALMFAYAGLILVTSGSGEGKTKAKGIFLNVVIGLAVAVGAWLIVKTLLALVGYNNTGMFF